MSSRPSNAVLARSGLRRGEFLRLVSALVGGLGLAKSPFAGDESSAGELLDESYLVKGLVGMAQARSWFDVHWGAGVLAGYYLCRDNPLDTATVLGIRAQLDLVLKGRVEQFERTVEEREDEALIEEVPRSLVPAMADGVRSHGHAVIFGSLATRALKDVPHMAQPSLIRALCQHSKRISRNAVKKPGVSEGYTDTQAMIEALFESLASFQGVLGYPAIHRPNFTHMTTHTEALLNLELMGYSELAKMGHLGHRAHLDEPVPFRQESEKTDLGKVTLERMMARAFWEDRKNHDRWRLPARFPDNPNGDWIASGHLFKVLYSFHRLIQRIDDPSKVELCGAILLERYFDPRVQGG